MLNALLGLFLFTGAAAADAAADVSTYFDNEKFVMYVNPNGTDISGIQSDFIYDARYITIQDLSFGKFLSKNDEFKTFGSKGKALPASIINVFEVILGPHYTNDPGVFLTISFTGKGCIKAANVKIANKDALAVPYNLNPACVLETGTISGTVTGAAKEDATMTAAWTQDCYKQGLNRGLSSDAAIQQCASAWDTRTDTGELNKAAVNLSTGGAVNQLKNSDPSISPTAYAPPVITSAQNKNEEEGFLGKLLSWFSAIWKRLIG